MNTRRTTKLIGLFLLGFVLFNFPVIQQFSTPYLIFNVPSLFSYIFATWLVLVIGVARISEELDRTPGENHRDKNKPGEYE